MRVTLYEIAQASGVSISTVSRIINNDPKKPASRATAEKVLKTAHELGYFESGYQVDAEGRPIYHHGTRTIACVLTSATDTFNDYFFSQILLGIQTEARLSGYNISQTLSAAEMDVNTLYDNLSSSRFDGLILMGRVSREVLEHLTSRTQNIVYAGLNRVNAGFDEVICDAYGAVKSVVDYIVSCGHRRIGFIGTMPAPDSKVVNEHRFSAFCEALKLHNLPLNLEYCRNIELMSQQGYNAAMELVKKKSIPDAVYCANDDVAIGVIRAFFDSGLRVPEDISVAGLDDVEIANYMRPRLTTVNMQKKELGRFAVKILKDRINKQHSVPVLIQLPYTLIEGESTARKRS